MMFIRPVCFLAILAFAVFTSLAQTPKPSPPDNSTKTTVTSPLEMKLRTDLLEGKVTGIESGDTFMVKVNGQFVYWVKLYAIDAPESGQPFFKESKKALSKLILNTDVKVVVYSTASTGQLIGTLLQNGRDVGLTMIEKGLAWHFGRYAYQQSTAGRISYADAQTVASTARTGLWSVDNPIPPWVFRGEPVSAPARLVEAGTTTQTAPVENERKYIMGPRGGCYYLTESGRKNYVPDKSLCGKPQPETKP